VSQIFPRIGFPQIVAVALLSTIVAAGAGTMCLLPAWTAPFHAAGCHPARVPTNQQPADYRCCAGRHYSALLTDIFSAPPALQPREADAIHIPAPLTSDNLSPTSPPGSCRPPGTYNSQDLIRNPVLHASSCVRSTARLDIE
jgi:hypothetical protein